MTISFLFIIYFSFAVSESRGNSLEAPEGKIFLKKNQDFVIPCKPSETSEFECQWMRNNQPVVIGKGRWDMYVWPKNPQNTSDCSIKFINSSAEYHEGNWQCSATDIHKEKSTITSKKIKVLVLEMPKNLSLEISQEGVLDSHEPFPSLTMLTVKAGSLLEVKCKSCCSRPKGELSWKRGPKIGKFIPNPTLDIKKGENLQNDSSWLLESTLTLKLTADDHRSQYYCNFFMKGAPPQHKPKTVAFNVVFFPESTNGTANVSFPKYSMAFLECPLKGNPVPTYQWSKENSENGEFQILEEATERILQVYFIQEEQLGLYKCSATSSLGDETRTGEAMLRLNFGMHPKIKLKGRKNRKT